MATFKGSGNQEWNIRICGPTIIDVRAEADAHFLLNDGEDNNTFARLEEDPALFCHVIYVLCKRQAVERKIENMTDFCFAVLEKGEALESAAKALKEAHENFTQPKKREFIKAVARRQAAAEDLAMEEAMAMIDDPQLEAEMKKAISSNIAGLRSKILTRLGSATDSPATAESLPED